MSRTASFLSRWGFALLVVAAAASAVGAAALSQPPADIPDFALRAAVVYRLEIGAAIFACLYLVSLAFVLALHNRGFSEIGTGSIKVSSISSRAEEQEATIAEIIDRVDRLEVGAAFLARGKESE